MENKADNFLDNISVARKTAILIIVITTGVFFLGAFGYLSTYKLKKSFSDFYETRYESTLKLEEISDIYTKDIKKSILLWENYKIIDAKISNENQKLYNLLVKKIDTHLQESEFILLKSDLVVLKSLLLQEAQIDKSLIEKRYHTSIWILIGVTLFLLVFSTIFTYEIIKNTKKMIYTLSGIVKSKMSDYEELAHNYEEKVTKEVIRNREKDQIMYQHARLASMGEMIGNIAHQWRQPLNALTILIQGFGTKSMTGKLDQDFIDKQVDEGLRLANQMSSTIEDFRNFFSPHRQREYFSIEQTLKETLELVEFFCKDEHIDITVQSKENLRVFGYSNEFSQVILNLINNARDNFKHRNINDERKILIKLEKRVKPKPFAIISFIDNGGGIEPKIKDRIFEPYFTTKHKSTGTGIGLYMSKQIIEKQMQGLVTMKNVESKMGGDKSYKCAQFIIAIPIK